MLTPTEWFIGGMVGMAVVATVAPGSFFGRGRIAPAVVSGALAWFLFGSHFSEAVKLDVGMFLAPYLLMKAMAQLLGGRR